MPYRSRIPCRHPGCPELVPYGTKYCTRHKPLHTEESRSAASRGYGGKWQKASKRFLEAHPLCVRCMAEGRYERATVVDHITPHRGDARLFWDEANWQPLCKRHHDVKTRNEDHDQEYHY